MNLFKKIILISSIVFSMSSYALEANISETIFFDIICEHTDIKSRYLRIINDPQNNGYLLYGKVGFGSGIYKTDSIYIDNIKGTIIEFSTDIHIDKRQEYSYTFTLHGSSGSITKSHKNNEVNKTEIIKLDNCTIKN